MGKGEGSLQLSIHLVGNRDFSLRLHQAHRVKKGESFSAAGLKEASLAELFPIDWEEVCVKPQEQS